MSGKSDFVTRLSVGLGLFLLAFALRALGADYGYFHGDERINDAAKVLAGQIVPGQHFYPPLITYLNGLAFGGLFALGLPLGWWGAPGEFRAQYFSDPTVFYLTARYLTAVIGALIAPLFFAIGRRVGLGLWPALTVGLLGVFFPLGVFMSHIAKGDVALATATVAVFWALIARLQAARPGRWDIWLGVLAVLVVSFKQSGVFVLLPLALGLAALLIRAEGVGAMARSMGRALLTVVLLWPVLVQGQGAAEQVARAVRGFSAMDGSGPLPRPDLVLVTHAHTDHMDPETLGPLRERFPDLPFVVPAAVEEIARDRIGPGAKLRPVQADDRLVPLPGLTLEVFPAAHEVRARDDMGRDRFLGYGIAVPGVRLYHSGDSVPFADLDARVQRFAPDIALLPVNGRDAVRRAARIPGNFTLEEARHLARECAFLVPHHFGMFAFNTLDPGAIDAAAARSTTPRIIRPTAGHHLRIGH